MISINKKKIATIEKHHQEKLRNKAMKMGVTIIAPETVFLSKDTIPFKHDNINNLAEHLLQQAHDLLLKIVLRPLLYLQSTIVLSVYYSFYLHLVIFYISPIRLV